MEKATAVYGHKAARSRDKSHLGRIDWRYERWRPAGRQAESQAASKGGRGTAYWVGMMRQAREGAAALRTGTAAVVARVGQGGGGWCAVFRGGVGSKEAAAGVRDEMR